MATDVIQKKVLLHAPLSRIWHALSDSTAFGAWFGMKFDGPFSPGVSMRGVLAPTRVNADVARAQEPFAGIPSDITIVQMEHERLFSFRWHPYALERGFDYSSEPTTLVVFELEPMEDGVMLTITESGFDQIPLERRAMAFAVDDYCWATVTELIGEYLALPQ